METIVGEIVVLVPEQNMALGYHDVMIMWRKQEMQIMIHIDRAWPLIKRKRWIQKRRK